MVAQAAQSAADLLCQVERLLLVAQRQDQAEDLPFVDQGQYDEESAEAAAPQPARNKRLYQGCRYIVHDDVLAARKADAEDVSGPRLDEGLAVQVDVQGSKTRPYPHLCALVVAQQHKGFLST
jgi:cytochrome c5